MTSSTKLRRWSAMFAKGVSSSRALGLYLLSIALLGGQAHAENCRMTLSDPRVDYGVIRPSQASSGKAIVVLGTPRTLHLSVFCTDHSAMALRFSGVAADAQGYQFGRRGRFTLNLRQAQVDGRPVSWQSDEALSGQLLPGRAVYASAGGAPVTGRRLTAQVEIAIQLPADALSVRREMLLEGHGQFELVSPAVP